MAPQHFREIATVEAIRTVVAVLPDPELREQIGRMATREAHLPESDQLVVERRSAERSPQRLVVEQAERFVRSVHIAKSSARLKRDVSCIEDPKVSRRRISAPAGRRCVHQNASGMLGGLSAPLAGVASPDRGAVRAIRQ